MAHKTEKSEVNGLSGDAPQESPREGSGAATAGEPNADASLSSLHEQLRRLAAEKAELHDTLLRRQADFENYRKRIEKERHHDRHRGVEHIVETILPVLDAFDTALASAAKDSASADYAKGFELIRRQLWDLLSKQGVTRIESVGKEFNPNFHHAIARVETTEQPDGTIVGELQPGYTFHDRVLRPAMVRVAAEPAHSNREN